MYGVLLSDRVHTSGNKNPIPLGESSEFCHPARNIGPGDTDFNGEAILYSCVLALAVRRRNSFLAIQASAPSTSRPASTIAMNAKRLSRIHLIGEFGAELGEFGAEPPLDPPGRSWPHTW